MGRARPRWFTTKPGVSLACIAVCPSVATKHGAAVTSSGEVRTPGITSTSRMSGTGLKKCRPRSRDGSCSPAAPDVRPASRWRTPRYPRGSGEAGDDDVVDEGLHGVMCGEPAGDDGPEYQVAGQQVPEFVADGGRRRSRRARRPAAGCGRIKAFRWSMNWCCSASLSAGLRDTSTSTARMVPACCWACSQYQRPPACSKSPRSVPVSGGTATWRTPSMNAANTNSAFVGQRRYTVALLARARGRDRVQRQPVIPVFLQQPQRHRKQLGLPRTTTCEDFAASIGNPGHSAHHRTAAVVPSSTVPNKLTKTSHLDQVQRR